MKFKLPTFNIPGPVKTLVKLAVLAAIVFLIVRKIDERVLLRTLGEAHPGWIVWAVGWYALSKVIAAFRFNTLLRADGIWLSHWENLKLYWLCMYYNLLLPGGISGDGYKIKVLMDAFGRTLKRLLAITLIDRVTGIVALGQLALLLVFWIPEIRAFWSWTVPAMILSLVASRMLYAWAGGNLPIAWRVTSLQSIGVQGAQMIATWGLVTALGQGSQWADYLILFLVSSVVAMLPITVGGAGARELTFLYGAQFLAIQAEQAVAIGILFYLMATAVAFTGIFFSFHPKAIVTPGTPVAPPDEKTQAA